MNLIYFKGQSKYEAENCLKLSIFLLNQRHGIHDGIKGGIDYIFKLEGINKTLIYHIYWHEGTYYLQLIEDSKVTDIELTKTYCNYGGQRFWFICPGLSQSCGRRVGVLYKPLHSEFLACRHCHHLTYQSSKRNGHERTYSKTLYELEEMREKIKRRWYAGKATKRYRKFLKEHERTNNSLIAFAKGLRKKIKRI